MAMSDALGLSVGTTNLVAARPGRPPVSRRSVLTIWNDRPAEVGVPAQNPELTSPNLTQAGLVLRGFVERVGDPVPLVAADGSAHRAEVLLASALQALTRAADEGRPPAGVVVAVPAHWGPAAVGALRGALRDTLSAAGLPPTVVSDATAALAALQVSPGLPGNGVVALCDFGGTGTSITLADAGAAFAPIGETVRYGEFSGDRIDQAVLNHVLAGAQGSGHSDPSGTTAVGALTRLREECRLAKERLSTETVTVVPAELPGLRSDIRLTRSELDGLIAEPFAGFLDALGDALERNRIPAANLSAIATVGGGAAIPAISQRLSEALRIPVITGPHPGLIAATGAAVLAGRGTTPEAATALAPVSADAPTGLAPASWAVRAAGQAATESASDGSPSATYRALAWSQGDDGAEEPVPYSGADYYTGVPPESGARPQTESETQDRYPDQDTVLVAPPLPWYRRPPLLFGIAAALAALAVGGLAVSLTSGDSTPTTTTTRVTKPGEPGASSAPPPPPVTTTVTGSDGQPTVTTLTSTTTAAPTSSSTTMPTTTTATTTTTPTTTTTTPTTTTTTTTTTPTTTTTTTTQPTTTTQTTTTQTTTTTAEPPPTTTTAPPTTTFEPPTTAEIVPTRPTPVEEPSPVPTVPTQPAAVEEPTAAQG